MNQDDDDGLVTCWLCDGKGGKHWRGWNFFSDCYRDTWHVCGLCKGSGLSKPHPLATLMPWLFISGKKGRKK